MLRIVPSISPCVLITAALALYPCSEICSCTNSSARSTFKVSSSSEPSGRPSGLGSKEPGSVDFVIWVSCRPEPEDSTFTREALKPEVLAFARLFAVTAARVAFEDIPGIADEKASEIISQ